MRKVSVSIIALLGLFLVVPAQAEPTTDEFARQVNLEPLKRLSIQHNQTLKTFETFSRQMLTTITGRASLDGHTASFTVLDMAFRPEDYSDRNIIRIKAIPIRDELGQELMRMGLIDEAEADRILRREGTVSLELLATEEAQQILTHIRANDMRREDAVRQVLGAGNTLYALSLPDYPFFTIIPPGTTEPDDHKWRNVAEVAGNIPRAVEWAQMHGLRAPEPLPGYDSAQLERAAAAMAFLSEGWRQRDAETVNKQIAILAEVLPQLNPHVYPPALKRGVEVVYNRAAKFTLPGAALYFVAFVLFLMSARSGVGGLRIAAVALFVSGFMIHTTGIGIRWWLVEKSVGNWFEAIPIKNQFESVLFSAWFGALVGLVLELRRSRGVFGAAASFVGWLSLVAIFTAPFITGREIGGEIGQAAGVLMSYWLYIHVTMAVAAYALIGMGFLLGIWWLVSYYRQPDPLAGLQRLDPAEEMAGGRQFLGVLDQCNLVVLQLAFWILGVAIVLGAVWADQSWGRPWAWDPKETFALVTWIVYLVIVHIRVATTHQAWWTSVLSIVGFFVMLFNWIGVNFFLVGLHSYA